MSKQDEKSKVVTVKIAVPVIETIDHIVDESPLEFRSRADFIKRAIERELRLRGKIKKYKD